MATICVILSTLNTELTRALKDLKTLSPFPLGQSKSRVALRRRGADNDHRIGQWKGLEVSPLFQIRTLATVINFLKCHIFKIESECVQTAWILQDPHRSGVLLTNKLTFRFCTEVR